MKTVVYILITIFLKFTLILEQVNSAEFSHICAESICKEISPHPAVVMVISSFPNGFTGQSTGFYINKKGDIATTLHSVRNAHNIKVITSNNKTYSSQNILKMDIMADIAIISSNTPEGEINPVSFASQSPLKGEKIYIVGHPLGSHQKIAQGTVSSLYNVVNFDTLIQFTAPMNVGSSGSPIFTGGGEVIGMAGFMLYTGERGYSSNFAMPTRRITRLN